METLIAAANDKTNSIIKRPESFFVGALPLDVNGGNTND